MRCDRCGRKMNSYWEIDGEEGVGGNCTDCGENLCAKCAGGWSEDGRCKRCVEVEERKKREAIPVRRGADNKRVEIDLLFERKQELNALLGISMP